MYSINYCKYHYRCWGRSPNIHFCNLILSSLDHFSFSSIRIYLCPIGLCNSYNIISTMINLNWIDLSRHSSSAIFVPKSGWYLACKLVVEMSQKWVIHKIVFAKHIWNTERNHCEGFSLNSDNSTCDSYMNTCHGVTLGLVTWDT